MCAYNKVNGEYACGNDMLLDKQIKDATGDKRMRLLGFERVALEPGASRTVTITADPRLLATFDGASGQWRTAAGPHRIAVGKSAGDLVSTAEVPLTARVFGT